MTNLMKQRIIVGSVMSGIALFSSVLAIRADDASEFSLTAIDKLDEQAAQEIRQGHKDKAISIWKDELALIEKSPDSLKATPAWLTLANHFEDQAREPKVAVAIYKRALSIFDRDIGPDAPQSMPVLLRLARIANRSKDKDTALQLYLQALKIAESAFGANDERVAEILDPIAGIYRDLKQWQKSESSAQRMISIYDKELEASAEYSATARNKLAEIYLAEGKFQDAEKPFTESVKSYGKVMGQNSLIVASMLDALADVYLREKKYSDCEQALKRSLAIKEKSLGLQNEYLIVTLEKHAELLKATGNPDKSREMLSRAARIRQLFPTANRTGLGL